MTRSKSMTTPAAITASRLAVIALLVVSPGCDQDPKSLPVDPRSLRVLHDAPGDAPQSTGATVAAGPDKASKGHNSRTTDGQFTLTVRATADDETRITVVVTAVDPVFKAITDVPEGLLTIGTVAPLLGSCQRLSDREIVFTPAFPLLRGHEYIVRFDPSRDDNIDGQPLLCRYPVPAAPTAPPPTLTTIFPSSKVLPANHLKFYLVFSEPMQPGDIWDHFRLLDLDLDQPVPRPFRHTELWSRDRRTLTLWFHPGRVKRGVNLNVEIGPILVEGRRYRLIVSGNWPSARGTSLGRDVSKTFTAGPPDHDQPNPKTWTIRSPAAGSRNPLVCQLGSIHDWALLHSDVAVVTNKGDPVAGSTRTADDESVWEFTPDRAWETGHYRLAIGSILEDLAGNSVERPFEVDITANGAQPRPDRKQPQTVFRNFEIRSPTPPESPQGRGQGKHRD